MPTAKQTNKTPLSSGQEAANDLVSAIVQAVATYWSIEHRRAILAGQAKRRERLRHEAAAGAHHD